VERVPTKLGCGFGALGTDAPLPPAAIDAHYGRPVLTLQLFPAWLYIFTKRLCSSMLPNDPASPAPHSPPTAPSQPQKGRSCLLYGCGTLLALVLLIAGTVA